MGVNWKLYGNLLLYDMEATWNKQKQCLGCAFKVVTLNKDVLHARNTHSSITYFQRLTDGKSLIKTHTLDELYETSMKGESNVVHDVF